MEIKKNNCYSIGFDLGGSSLKYGYGNKKEGLLYFNTLHHEDKSLEGLIKLFNKALSDLTSLTSEGCDYKHSFTALGIATPGIVDTKNGVVLDSTPNLPFLKNLNLKSILNDITNIPVFVENDANLMTLAEASILSDKNVIGITIGTGIGTGFVQNISNIDDKKLSKSLNKIFKGENLKAMEAGHIIVVPNGRLCLCGKKGCLEAYCSAESMKRIIFEEYPDLNNMTLNSILKINEKKIQKKIYQIYDIFAVGLANLIVILDPGSIILGGGLVEDENYDFEYIKNKIFSNLTSIYQNVKIHKACYGNKAGVIGAILFSINL
ncbi:MAG: ROK family protein [Candidatus Cloacimonetes bacterium]|nr:ROK family protein [Candidatus Cloacimonadota bacterium]